MAAAPSLTPDALPAVTVPGVRNAARSLASCSMVVSGRGCSSLSTMMGPALPPGPLHRHDLLGEIAARHRLGGALLRAQRQRILILASHLVVGGDVLAGLAHGVDAILRLHERIDEAPADGGVEHFGAA